MSRRAVLVVGSALAAASVGVVCLIAFFQWFGALRHLVGFADQLFVLAIMPAVVAACLSSAWVSASKRFEYRGDLSNAVRICLLAYPILFLALLATIWIWLQFERYLPIHERPGNLLGMAGTAAGYASLAFIVGFLPAAFIEYFLIRFARKRWSSALLAGVAL